MKSEISIWKLNIKEYKFTNEKYNFLIVSHLKKLDFHYIKLQFNIFGNYTISFIKYYSFQKNCKKSQKTIENNRIRFGIFQTVTIY